MKGARSRIDTLQPLKGSIPEAGRFGYHLVLNRIAIAAVLSDMDAEIPPALEARRDKTRSIKQGMMQQLLTGRVRLVKPAAAEASA